MIAHLLIGWLILSVAIFLTSKVLPGIDVQSFGKAMVAAIVLALLNLLLRPVLGFIFAPVTWLTLGLFSLVLNGIVLMIAGSLVSGFRVQGCLWATLGAILISLLRSALFHLLY